MEELADTPDQALQPILLELGNYLGGQSKVKLPKDSCARVESLLAKAKQNPAYENWRALLLHFEAKHHLSLSDIDNATKCFRSALEASSERGFGSLKGEIALDCLAAEVANQKLLPNNHENYYRAILGWGVFNNRKVPDIYGAACEAADYFWDQLYSPYPGIRPLKPLSLEALENSFRFILAGDIAGLETWIKNSSRDLGMSLKCITGDSVLMQWIKLRSHFNDHLPVMRQFAPPDLESELQKVEGVLVTWRHAIKLLCAKVPKQLSFSDFKGQTPLMLVAEAGDGELVRAFLDAGADPDLQDFEGRSALHSAIKSHDKDSVDALLEHPCTVSLETVDGRSPLHTAAWSGNGYGVDQIVALSPQLAWQRDSHNRTPLELAETLCGDPNALAYLNKELAKQRRKPVLTESIEALIDSLQNAPVIN